jgi:hypothetical protein
MAGDVGVIWGGGEEEYFLTASLTGKSLICPAGKSVDGSPQPNSSLRAKQSNPSSPEKRMDCFASLAMTEKR